MKYPIPTAIMTSISSIPRTLRGSLSGLYLFLLALCTAQSAYATIIPLNLQGTAGAGLLPGNEPGSITGVGSGGEMGVGITYDTVTRVLDLTNIGWGSSQGFTDLSSSATASHLHGPTGSNNGNGFTQTAGALHTLTRSSSAVTGGTFTNPLIDLDTAFGSSAVTREAELLAGRFYINVHTANNPGGEIRGFLVPAPSDIAVSQAGALSDAVSSVSMGTVVAGSNSAAFSFTITNPGTSDLTNLVVTKDGTNAAEFSVSALSGTSIPVGSGTVTFTVTFTPGGSTGARSAAIHIASNVVGSKNPFDINLTGQALSPQNDTDGDGMNDAAEFALATLGFNWQVGQSALVNTYYTNANVAGLYTPSQVQALNVGVPLIQKNPTTGVFTLTIGVEKSTNLSTFTPFPLNAPGASTTINGAGKLDFQFTVPDNAAFFKLGAQ